MTYEEWKTTRLERVPGRCGGNPTFKGTRLQPHDIIWADDRQALEDAEFWGYDNQDIQYAKRFAVEEPHWRILSRGLDLHGREVPEEEYEQLRLKYRCGWEG